MRISFLTMFVCFAHNVVGYDGIYEAKGTQGDVWGDVAMEHTSSKMFLHDDTAQRKAMCLNLNKTSDTLTRHVDMCTTEDTFFEHEEKKGGSGEPLFAKSQTIEALPSWWFLRCSFPDKVGAVPTTDYLDTLTGENGWLWDYWKTQTGSESIGEGSARSTSIILPRTHAAYFNAQGFANLQLLADDCIQASLATLPEDADTLYGLVFMFNAPLDCCAWGGGYYTTIRGQTRRYGVAWLPPFGWRDTAVITHEMAHAYGVPHTNNSDKDATHLDNPWDSMSDPFGYSASLAPFGRLPKNLSLGARWMRGWVNEETIGVFEGEGNYAITLQPAFTVLEEESGVSNPDALKGVVLRAPEWPAHRWILAEYRTQNDVFDANLPGSGLILTEYHQGRPQPEWHVDRETPTVTYSNGRGSWMEPGDTWRSQDGRLSVTVQALDELNVQMKVNIVPIIFSGSFD